MLQEVHDSFYVHIFKHPELEQSYVSHYTYVFGEKKCLINFVNYEFKVFFQLNCYLLSNSTFKLIRKKIVSHKSPLLTTFKLIKD